MQPSHDGFETEKTITIIFMYGAYHDVRVKLPVKKFYFSSELKAAFRSFCSAEVEPDLLKVKDDGISFFKNGELMTDGPISLLELRSSTSINVIIDKSQDCSKVNVTANVPSLTFTLSMGVVHEITLMNWDDIMRDEGLFDVRRHVEKVTSEVRRCGRTTGPSVITTETYWNAMSFGNRYAILVTLCSANINKAEESIQEPVQRYKFDNKNTDGIPFDFICPISLGVMTNPVIASDRNVYDESSLLAWFAHCREKNTNREITSPLTGAPLVSDQVIPAVYLKKSIDEFNTVKNTPACSPCASSSPSSSSSAMAPITAPIVPATAAPLSSLTAAKPVNLPAVALGDKVSRYVQFQSSDNLSKFMQKMTAQPIFGAVPFNQVGKPYMVEIIPTGFWGHYESLYFDEGISECNGKQQLPIRLQTYQFSTLEQATAFLNETRLAHCSCKLYKGPTLSSGYHPSASLYSITISEGYIDIFYREIYDHKLLSFYAEACGGNEVCGKAAELAEPQSLVYASNSNII